MAKEASNTTHVRPDFAIKAEDTKSKQKKMETLRKEEADLIQQLADKRKEIAALGTLRTPTEGGFSNAPSAKEQQEANKATQEENAKTSTATKNK